MARAVQGQAGCQDSIQVFPPRWQGLGHLNCHLLPLSVCLKDKNCSLESGPREKRRSALDVSMSPARPGACHFSLKYFEERLCWAFG